MTFDPDVWDLAEKCLKGAPKAQIEALASSLQRRCDDACEGYDAWKRDQGDEGDLGHLTISGGTR